MLFLLRRLVMLFLLHPPLFTIPATRFLLPKLELLVSVWRKPLQPLPVPLAFRRTQSCKNKEKD
jgi:hypothetical protein